MCPVVAAGRGDRRNDLRARVDLLGQPLDRAALAGRVPPFEDNRHRPFLLVELEAEQVRLRLEQSPFALILPFVQPCAQIDMPPAAGANMAGTGAGATPFVSPAGLPASRAAHSRRRPTPERSDASSLPSPTAASAPKRASSARSVASSTAQSGVAAVCRRDDQPGGVGAYRCTPAGPRRRRARRRTAGSASGPRP